MGLEGSGGEKQPCLDGSVGAAADCRHSRSCFAAAGACSVNLLSAAVSVKATQQRRTATNRPCQEIRCFFPAPPLQSFISLFVSVPIYRKHWTVKGRRVCRLVPITLSCQVCAVTLSRRFKVLLLNYAQYPLVLL